ncbi:hypothetical protein E6C76_02185 [Pseudothauera nasutitermitis]|uniref:Uncharacterized protein n=1 Tax=Pseudothauera nasutitermitis TaxID=2565930 RepID=A0A4S4B4J3_9RHOO|nr:hypothetical protein E6C76_02185 [Pseudothauera nasutitermitis]
MRTAAGAPSGAPVFCFTPTPPPKFDGVRIGHMPALSATCSGFPSDCSWLALGFRGCPKSQHG